MKKTLTKIYNESQRPHIEKVAPKENVFFKTSYINGATCEIFGESTAKYNIRFIDLKTGEEVHKDVLPVNHWTAANRKWYTNWKIEVTNESTREIVFSEEMDLKNKKVLVSLDSGSLGDTISWIPYLEKFQEKHNCKVFCRTPFSDLFEKVYPNITFINEEPEGLYATYRIGWFDDWQNQDKNPDDPRLIPLQKTASGILGLDHEEEKTRIYIKNKDRPIKEKYVCISTASTSACRHWQNPTGWQETVDYLNTLGYKVVVIQKEALDWMDLNGLDNVTHPEEENIQDAVTWLNSCEFFIGLDSGISWLAWALGKKVISISGFSLSFQRYHAPHKIQNKDVCHGCWNNENFLFDKGDWNWCPIHKGTDRQFECTKSITFDTVKENIDKIIKKKVSVVLTANGRKKEPTIKIAVQIMAYNCAKAFPKLLEPWVNLKDELNLKFWVHSRQFKIYEEMGCEDLNSETLSMLKKEYSEIIDYLSVPEKALSDHDSRSLCLDYCEKEDIDLIFMLDADEFYTKEQIENTIDFVKNNPLFDWYAIQLKNYIGDEGDWVDFAPVRLIWTKRHGGIKHYYWDNHFSYKDGAEYRTYPNKTIPKDIAFPDHYTWTNGMNTTGPKHIKEKIEYQKRFYSDGCGYKWNEEKQSIEVNKDNG